MSATSPPELDDDISGQIKTLMSRPISDPQQEIRQFSVDLYLMEKRVKRIEKVAWWLISAILAASLSVMGTVIWASFSLGARMEALTQVGERVQAIEERLARVSP